MNTRQKTYRDAELSMKLCLLVWRRYAHVSEQELGHARKYESQSFLYLTRSVSSGLSKDYTR